MSNDDMPIVVFAGRYAEAIFLKTLIELAGIQTTLVDDFHANGHQTKE